MPGWSEILAEIKQEIELRQQLSQQNPQDLRLQVSGPDFVRRKYLKQLSDATCRNTIIYASGWLQKSQIPADKITIHPSDVDGFLEAVKTCDKGNKKLDLIIHSPGGSPEAAEQIINYLRSKFDEIRVIVPHMAMSAATMMSCAANIVMMGRHSTLGPTDPQMLIRTNTGEIRFVAAHSLLKDFEEAAQSDGNAYRAWAPIIAQYPPGLKSECEKSIELSKQLVEKWLKSYMFNGEKDFKKKAKNLTEFFTSDKHLSHGRPLMIEQLSEEGLNIETLEQDNEIQDLVMSVYHATTHTLGGTPAVKIIENHNGYAFVNSVAS